MTDRLSKSPLHGLSPEVQRVMGRLLRMPPEQQKAAPKPENARAEAQRQRRQKERAAASEANDAL
jgi:hypothetical protein